MKTNTDIKPRKRIIGLFTQLLGYGGVQEAGRHTAASLTNYAHRHHCSVCFLSLNDPWGHHSMLFDQSMILFHGSQRSKTNFVVSALRATDAFSAGEKRLVVAGHPNLAPITLACKYLIPRTKTVVICHGVEVWTRLSALRRHALLNADLVLVPSRYTLDKLLTVQSLPSTKVRLLPWPLSENLLCMADSPTILSAPPGYPEGRVILTVGRWVASEQYKGTDRLIRAVASLRQKENKLKLVVVGGGDDIPRLRRVAADFSISDHVDFLGTLSNEHLAACYARAEIFALPSTGEGLGLVFLEAMAFGKAVVAAQAGGATDVIENGATGLLVPPGDQGALVRALETLLEDPGLRSHLGKEAAGIVRQRYRFTAFCSEIEKIANESLSD